MSEKQVVGTLQRVKEKYLFDPRTGLYYDLYPLVRGGGDDDAFEDRVNEAGKYLNSIEPSDKVWMPTLYLLQSQIDEFPEALKVKLGAKSFMMLFDPGKDYGTIDIQYWRDYATDLFIWSSNDRVFTWCVPDMLSHRFRIVNKSEVGSYDEPVAPPVVPPVVYPTIPKKWHMSGSAKFSLFSGFSDIDITVEAVEEE